MPSSSYLSKPNWNLGQRFRYGLGFCSGLFFGWVYGIYKMFDRQGTSSYPRPQYSAWKWALPRLLESIWKAPGILGRFLAFGKASKNNKVKPAPIESSVFVPKPPSPTQRLSRTPRYQPRRSLTELHRLYRIHTTNGDQAAALQIVDEILAIRGKDYFKSAPKLEYVITTDNQRFDLRTTYLIQAIQGKCPKVAHKLLDCGAPVNEIAESPLSHHQGQSALIAASQAIPFLKIVIKA